MNGVICQESASLVALFHVFRDQGRALQWEIKKSKAFSRTADIPDIRNDFKVVRYS